MQGQSQGTNLGFEESVQNGNSAKTYASFACHLAGVNRKEYDGVFKV